MRMTLRNDLLLLAALTLALVFALLMAAPSLSELDFGQFGGGEASSTGADAVALQASPAGEPAWLEHPLEPPLAAMQDATAQR